MTKVKPRVISQALKELIDEASNIIIMGHKNTDADSLGAAMGIYALAHAHKKEANIVYTSSKIFFLIILFIVHNV